MIDKIRTFAQYKVVKWIFAIFLIIPFGLFGIDYYFRTPLGGDTIATVGNMRVSQGDFDQALRQQQETLQAQFGTQLRLLDHGEPRGSPLRARARHQRAAHRASAPSTSGVKIDDKQLADRIAAEPAFQEDGKFSKERYEAIARAQGFTVVGLDERLREDMRLARYRDAIVQTAFVPRSTLDGFIRLSEQSREVSMVNVGPEAFLAGGEGHARSRLKAYYDGPRQGLRRCPSRCAWSTWSCRWTRSRRTRPVDPEEVKKFYESNKSRFVQREERRASHILLTVKPDAPEAEQKAVEAKAAAIAAQLRKKPASFAEVAKKESQDPGSAAQGGDLGFFARGAMVKPFEDAAFAAKKDEIVGPVRSDFGWHVIRVTDVKPEKGKSLAEATPEIEAELRKGVAARRFAEVAEGLTNMVYEQSTSLKPAADQYGLAIQQTGWFAKARRRAARCSPTRSSWRRSSPTTRSRRSATRPPSRWRPSVLVVRARRRAQAGRAAPLRDGARRDRAALSSARRRSSSPSPTARRSSRPRRRARTPASSGRRRWR